jgi:hypothetical protein
MYYCDVPIPISPFPSCCARSIIVDVTFPSNGALPPQEPDTQARNARRSQTSAYRVGVDVAPVGPFLNWVLSLTSSFLHCLFLVSFAMFLVIIGFLSLLQKQFQDAIATGRVCSR